MYHKFLYSLVVFFLLAGCSNKVNKYENPQDTLHEQAITQTKKAVINSGKNIEAYITATYINQVEHKLAGRDENFERFIVSIYVPNSEYKLEYNDIHIMINDISTAQSIKKLKNSDDILEILSSSNPWAKYYLIEIPSIKTRTLTLSFDTYVYKSAKLSFKKDYL